MSDRVKNRQWQQDLEAVESDVKDLLHVFKEVPIEARSKQMCALLNKYRKQTEKILDEVVAQGESFNQDTGSESTGLDDVDN